MRVLVISDLPQFVTGGAEKQASHLIEAWMDAGHNVTCYGRRMGPGPVRIGRHELSVQRIRVVHRCGRLTRAATYFVSLCMLLLRQRRQFDVIYTRFLGEAAITVSLLIRLGLLRSILVSTPANTSGKGDATFLSSIPFKKYLVRLLDSKCDAINLIAPAMADELRGIGFSGRNFSHIPNGVVIYREPLPDKERSNWFLAVGRITHQKGYDVLFQALSQVRSQLGPGMIRIAGDGPDRQALESLATTCGISGAITWLREVDHSTVLDELGRARVFLLPSRYEGLSNAGLEAMERGLAMIVTRCGGLDTYIRTDMGWVVDPGDVSMLKRALEAALSASPETLTEMGRCCRALALKKFDIKIVAARYLELFQQLVESRRGHIRS